MLPAVGYPAIL
jgi:hypothetical protein